MSIFAQFCESGLLLNLTINYQDTSENETEEDGPIITTVDGAKNPLDLLQRVAFGILVFILVTVAILGNVLTFFTIYKKNYQILYKCCLVSQALSDCLYAVFIAADSVNRFVYDDVIWRFGWFMCGWIPYITTLCVLISSMTVTCIAFDRYQSIVLLRGKWDPNLMISLFTVGLIWLIAGGISVPTFLGYKMREVCILDYEAFTSTYTHVCMDKKEKNENYFTTVFIVIFLPLLAAFTGLYSLIANSVYIRRKKLQKYEHSSSTEETAIEHSVPHSTGERIESGKRVAVKKPTKGASYTEKKIRTFKLILVIMITFMVCRLPQWIFIVVDVDLNSNSLYVCKYLLSSLSLSNAAINPFVYSFLNEIINLKENISSGFKKWRLGFCGRKFMKVYTVHN